MSVPRILALLLSLFLLSPAGPAAAHAAAASPTAASALAGTASVPSSGTAAEPAPRLNIGQLGIHRPIYTWGCRGGTLPDQVWSWTCSGRNNLYLLGHAYGVFKPLHDAYTRGKLHPGMRLVLSSGPGERHLYRLSWYRLVRASALGTDMWGPGSTWAWNATQDPVVTLQTCYGRNSEFRLIVRFRLIS